jgi:uncharacterized membrane protein
MKVLASLALVLICGLSATAQDRRSVEVQVSAGARNSITEGTCSNGTPQPTFAVSFRYHVTPKTSVGPEIAYVRPCVRQVFTYFHPNSSQMLQIARDLTNGKKVRPYLIGGIGVVQHLESGGRGRSSRLEAVGGAGVKFFLTKRFFVAPEFRVTGGAPSMWFSVGGGYVIR